MTTSTIKPCATRATSSASRDEALTKLSMTFMWMRCVARAIIFVDERWMRHTSLETSEQVRARLATSWVSRNPMIAKAVSWSKESIRVSAIDAESWLVRESADDRRAEQEVLVQLSSDSSGSVLGICTRDL